MKKHNNKGKFITLITGLILLLSAVFIYILDIQGFWREVMSELFAFGFLITLVTIILFIFKVKIKMGG